MGKYTPRHDTQYEPFVRLSSSKGCNMAAAADAARFWSLDLIDKNHDEMRRLSGTYWELTDGNPQNDGTNISDAETALERAGVTGVKSYDWADGRTFADVKRALAGRGVLIAHGDYGSVPMGYRGPIARHFEGSHSVLFHSLRTVSGRVHVVVGDGLSNDWMLWPLETANKYMRDFPGVGYTYALITPRLLHAKVARANVRKLPKRANNILGRITPRSSVHFGGTVRGEQIGRNSKWYRVFYNGRIGFVHSSVANPR